MTHWGSIPYKLSDISILRDMLSKILMKDNLMDIQNLNIRAKTESLIPDLKISVQLH